ncbi:unnamed protein product [Penicillium salamii]|uniref:Amidohydrolase-related domain-containing protein n=1 Tax=Penicillium salamii TaxID=1612424 RepID=A0A9W4NSV0_9EURO|nr:unnamed protein product [Penicillium salamii]
MSGKYLFIGSYVATLDDILRDFPNGAVLVENDIIQAVGQAEDIKCPNAEVIDATDGVVIPGIIDTHRHTSISLTQGLGADQSLFHFLSNTYLRWLPATSVDDIELSSIVGGLKALNNSMTIILNTCETFSFGDHAEAEFNRLKELRVRAFYCFAIGDDALLCYSYSYAVENSITTKDIKDHANYRLIILGYVYIHYTNLTKRKIELIAESKGKVSIAIETKMQIDLRIPLIRAYIEHSINPFLSINTSSAVVPNLLG